MASATIDLPAGALTRVVFAGVEGHPDRPAFIDDPSGRMLTHAQVVDHAHRMAGRLLADGFEPGDVMAIMTPNMPEYAVAFHAVVLAGGTVTMVNPTYTIDEARHQLRDAAARLLLTVPSVATTAHRAIEGTSVDRVIVVDDTADDPLADMIDHRPVDQMPVDPASSVAALPYSYGIGGPSKGVMLSHTCLAANLAQLEAMFPIEDGESTIAVLPFSHTYGLGVLLNGVLSRGGTAVTMTRFRFDRFLELITRHRATRLYVVPPIVWGLAMYPAVGDHDLTSLRQVMCGGSPLTPTVAAMASERIGCEVTQGYGLTEASPVTHSTPPGFDRPGASGIALPNTEARITDTVDGSDRRTGETGEIRIRGPQVMLGYHGRPEATREVLDDTGWLRTGDLGRVDADGYLFVTGRTKPIFKCKGLQVSPAELESLLCMHPKVSAARVHPVEDPLWGERPVATIVPTPPTSHPDVTEIAAFVTRQVAPHKRIARIEVNPSLTGAL